jgi:hypothetical protein
MENQHRHIKGYRELLPQEIDLMNRIKEKGAELLALQAEVNGRLFTDREVKLAAANSAQAGTGFDVYQGASPEAIEYRRFNDAEPIRWASIAKTDIQTGLMALVRAIAQPSNP